MAVSAGYLHTCAILDNGDLKCWGSDNNGQLGDGGTIDPNDPHAYTSAPSSTAIDLGTGRTAVAVSAGREHTCAILDNGDLKCWGDDSKGQLGDGGTNTDTSAPSSTAIDLGTGRTAVAVAAGNTHTCAILDNGEAKCWGSDSSGQLGDGGGTTHNTYTYTAAPSSTAIDLGTGRTAVALSAGLKSTCAILDNGEAKCWGDYARGLLGLGQFTGQTNAYAPPSTAIDFGTGRTAVAISTGWEHACALLNDGNLSCWGNDNNGRLGNGGGNVDKWTPDLIGSGTWDSSTGLSSGSGGGMTNVTGATACTASPNLPTGLNIDSSTCTISGTPTVEAVNATYEINATIGGVTYIGSVWLSAAPFGTITSAVDGAALNLGEAMTPIALNYTSQAPPGSSGNGTVWTPTPPSGTSIFTSPRMGDYFMLEHDDVIYFDARMSNGKKAVYAFSTVNGTMWNTYDISSITSATSFQPYTGNLLAQFVGDDLFFTVKNSTSASIYELWVYSTSNGTTWRAMQQTASTYGLTMEFVIGDRLYFDEHAWTGGSGTTPFIGVYDTSNHSYWNYSTTMLNYGIGSCPAPGANFHAVVGDTIYFDACDASQSYGVEMYAFNTVNGSYWRVADLDNGTNHSWPGKRMHIVIDDVIYFDAQVGTGAINTHALYAYNTSNGTIWLAADLSEPGYHMKPHSMASAIQWRKPVVIGDTMYFDARASPYTARTSIGSTCATHTEIYAYNIGNQTAWCVADAGGPGWSGSGHNSDAAHNMLYLVGDVLLFDAETGSTQGALKHEHTVCGHTTCPTAQPGKSVPYPRNLIGSKKLEMVSMHFQQTMRCTSPPKTTPWEWKFGATTLLTKHTGW